MGERLDENLAKLEGCEKDILSLIEKAIGLCTVALLDMKDKVIQEGFDNTTCEINFFKQVKPSVYSRLVYYIKRMNLETHRQALARKSQLTYLTDAIRELEEYYLTHADLYKYYRLNLDYMDEQYFLRHYTCKQTDIEYIHQLMDLDFSSPQDHRWAAFMAHERLIKELEYELEELKSGKSTEVVKAQHLPGCDFKWTESKVALIELIYALHSTRSINDGQFSIKNMVLLFERLFNIELGDVYRVFLEIRGRKVERTKYLDLLKDCLLRRMDDWDNRDVNE